MECRYCQAANADDDHRCRRCGRRLRSSLTLSEPLYTGSSAAAPVLNERAAPVLQGRTAPVLQAVEAGGPARRASNRTDAHRSQEPRAPRRPVNYQPSLFPSRELPLVVQFETIAPHLVQSPPRKSQASTPRQRRRKVMTGQQAIDFAYAAKPANAAIYGDARVAIPAHRAMAAALDASMMLMALAVFGIVFRLAGGVFVLNAKTAPIFLGVAAGIAIFYRLLWCLANGDTVGQKWTRLRLVNFDGQPPTRAQRFYRTASGFLSVLAGGIGLLWGLVDEETLTWHDHISKTFPTPVTYTGTASDLA
jgi:uncharacterized RDD family membrane protein YckC